MRSVNFKTNHNNILICLREWEGVGAPDYSTIDTLSIINAEGLVKSLQECIEQAKMNEIDMNNRRIETLRKEIEERQSELDSLEMRSKFKKSKIGSPTTPPVGGPAETKSIHKS